MNKKLSIVIAALILVIVVLAGTFFYKHTENWNIVDSFYFTVMTVTTVGYGDLVPTHNVSKIATSIYSLVGIPLVLFVFGILAENYLESRVNSLEKRLKEVIQEEKKIATEVEELEEKV